MDYETLITKKEDGILTIQFNRPDEKNTANERFLIELTDVLLSADKDAEVRVVIMTGSGTAFCAGADVAEGVRRMEAGTHIPASLDYMVPAQSSYHLIPMILRQMKKPTIAAINGYAFGGGFGLAIACDIRIASDQAKMGLPFVRAGLSPESGSSYSLPRMIGIGRACELIFTGDTVDAYQMERWGLVNHVVSAEELEGFTLALAGKIAKAPTLAVQLSKRALYQGLDAEFSTQLQFETLAAGVCARTEDHKEAFRAFAEKRTQALKEK
jgi:2-(1,2-epoxy-1,2-dihydrophenyl)acetyl-CoA isomerase